MRGQPVGSTSRTGRPAPAPTRGAVSPAPRGAKTARWLALAALGGLLATACRSPFDTRAAGVQETVAAAVDREIASLGENPAARETEPPPGEVLSTLAARREELESYGPATASARTPFTLGLDLTGAEQQVVELGLETAVRTAVGTNLSIRIAALEPAVNREDLLAAEAVFDVVFFGSANLDKIDEPQPAFAIFNTIIGTPFRKQDTHRFETGVRKRLLTGGTVTLSTELTRFRNKSPGTTLLPDPAYTAVARLGLSQPLLRGFGDEVNTATIRLAANTERRAVAQLTTDLLELVEDVDRTYWDLVFAWRDVEIRQWLVDVGELVRKNLGDRLDFDTKPAEYSDAVARVEQRKADVIRARRAVRRGSDRLKVLMNDPELTIGSETVLRPVDPFVDSAIRYSLREMIVSALGNRPEIVQALLSIDDASIRAAVADNGRLPLLDLTAQVAYFGQDDDPSTAYGNALDNQFIDYVLGFTFEYPLGNRGPEADYRRSRLQRAQSLVGYHSAVQNVVLEVKDALRDVVANYELIQATRSQRIAQAENLRTLEAEEPLRGLTPEFLNLKFQRQDRLATARQGELQALVNFDQSLAALYRATGTGLERHGIDVRVAGGGGEDPPPRPVR